MMPLFNTGAGFFAKGVVEQGNVNRQLSLQEVALDLQKTKFKAELDAAQKEQAGKFIEELVSIAGDMKKNFKGTSEEFATSKAGQGAMELIAKAQEVAQQTGINFSGESALDATKTEVDEALLKAEGEVRGTGAKIEAAGDDPTMQSALGVAPPDPNSMVLVHPGTGDFKMIPDATTPGGRQQVARLARAGYVKSTFSFQPTAAGDFPGVQKKEVIQFRDQEVASLTALDILDEMEGSLDESATLTGFASATFKSVTGAVGSVQQLAKVMGGEATVGNKVVDESLLLEQSYDFSKFKEPSLNTGAFRSNMISLAYMRARSLDPSGRVSDQDVQNMINSMGADSGNKDLIRGAFGAVRRQIKFAIRNRHKVLSRDDPNVPALDPRFSDDRPDPLADAVTSAMSSMSPEQKTKFVEWLTDKNTPLTEEEKRLFEGAEKAIEGAQ